MSNKSIQQRVGTFISQHHLIPDGGLCLVALSGGADSVAMLLILKELGYEIEAVHCNFLLRGEEADRDEQFCVYLCRQNAVKLHRIHFDTRTYAELHKQSIEMAARELRYTYFNQLKEDIGADVICVGHHQDDSVETVLLNLIRGTGLTGLTGIRPRRDDIVRPMLCLTRHEITNYLAEHNQPFVTDSTNLQAEEATRNRIRLEVLPLLKKINPAASNNIHRTSLHLQQASAIVEEVVKSAVAEVSTPSGDVKSIDINKLKKQPSPQYLFHHLLKEYGFSSAQTEEIAANLDAPTGTTFQSASTVLVFDRGRILIAPLSPTPGKTMRIPEEGIYVYDESRKFSFRKTERPSSYKIPNDSNKACLDGDKVTFPLTVAPYVAGDRFQPLGMSGSRLVSDFLTDRKRSLLDKRKQLVVKDAQGSIVWVVSERIDHRFRITPDTNRVLEISLEKEEGAGRQSCNDLPTRPL